MAIELERIKEISARANQAEDFELFALARPVAECLAEALVIIDQLQNPVPIESTAHPSRRYVALDEAILALVSDEQPIRPAELIELTCCRHIGAVTWQGLRIPARKGWDKKRLVFARMQWLRRAGSLRYVQTGDDRGWCTA